MNNYVLHKKKIEVFLGSKKHMKKCYFKRICIFIETFNVLLIKVLKIENSFEHKYFLHK